MHQKFHTQKTVLSNLECSNSYLIKITKRDRERSGPHLEAKSRGNGNGIVEDISDVRDIEATLEVLLKLWFPFRIIVIDWRPLFIGLGRHADLLGESCGVKSRETGIQVRESIIRRRRWRRAAVREVVARKSEFSGDRMRQSAHQTEITRLG